MAGWPADDGVRASGKIRRRIRQHYREHVEASVPDGLTPIERHAVALRVAARAAHPELVHDYRRRLRELPMSLKLIAAVEAGGRAVPRRLDAILRFADLLASDARAPRLAHLKVLQAQGLMIADIAALARLVAFVTYEANLLATLNFPGKGGETKSRPIEAAVAARPPSPTSRNRQPARNSPS